MTRLRIFTPCLALALGLAVPAFAQQPGDMPPDEDTMPPDDTGDIPGGETTYEGEDMIPDDEPQAEDIDPDADEPFGPQPYEDTSPPADAPTTVVVPAETTPERTEERRFATLIGTSISLGGGVIDFTDGDMRDFTDLGGAWEARVVVGTRARFAVEAAYVGSAQDIQALGLDDDAALLSNGVEGLARANLLTGPFQPYVGGGVGWRRYDLMNEAFNTSSVNDDDNVLEVPVAAGLAYRVQSLVIDLRTMVRFAFLEDLVGPDVAGDSPNQHSWGGQLTAGWEF